MVDNDNIESPKNNESDPPNACSEDVGRVIDVSDKNSQKEHDSSDAGDIVEISRRDTIAGLGGLGLFGNGGWSWVTQSGSDHSTSFIEDFESGELAKWTVDEVGGRGNSTVQVTDNNPYGGTYSLDYQGNIQTWMASTGSGLPYPQRGDSFELRWYYATRGSGGFGFAAQSDSFNNGYQVQVRSDTWSANPDTVTLYRRQGGQRAKQIARADFDMSAYTNQYLRWTVEWGYPTITVTGYTADGTEIVTLKGDDTTYDQGGIQCEANCTNRDAVYFDAWKFINRPPDVNGDGNKARDPDDDGLYEDVNGDGDVNVGDAQTLFNSQDSEPVQDHMELFDFNSDQSLNVGDAQALFDEVTRG